MSCSSINFAKTIAGSSVTIRNQIIDSNGDAITQASVTSITSEIFDISTPTTATTPTVVVASTVFDTPQTWAESGLAGGFNFAFAIPGASLPTASARYRVIFSFTMTTGEDFILVWEVWTTDPRG